MENEIKFIIAQAKQFDRFISSLEPEQGEETIYTLDAVEGVGSEKESNNE